MSDKRRKRRSGGGGNWSLSQSQERQNEVYWENYAPSATSNPQPTANSNGGGGFIGSALQTLGTMLGWQPGGKDTAPDVGVIVGTDQVVSFKTNEDRDQVLIRDGDYGNHDGTKDSQARAAEFNRNSHHDHYYNDRQTGQREEQVRGYHNNSSYKGS